MQLFTAGLQWDQGRPVERGGPRRCAVRDGGAGRAGQGRDGGKCVPAGWLALTCP